MSERLVSAGIFRSDTASQVEDDAPAPACSIVREAEDGAGDGIRTRNRLFTKQVLYH